MMLIHTLCTNTVFMSFMYGLAQTSKAKQSMKRCMKAACVTRTGMWIHGHKGMAAFP